MISAPAGRRRLLLQAAVAAVLVVAACTIEVNIDSRGDNADEAASAVTTTKAAVEAPKAAVPSEAPAEARKTSPKGTTTPPATAVVPKPNPESLASEPTFTPYTVAPSILNRNEVIKAMEKDYPPLLRDAGIGGTVKVYFFIDETGKVLNRRIDSSSGHQALDDAALRVASVYRFSPALNRDKKVPVWVSFPITFQVR